MRGAVGVVAFWLVFLSGAASAFDMPDFLKLVASPEVRRVEDVLARLPEDLRTHYVLMARSRSLQGATPEYPRVILFGRRATLFVSFNGHPDQRGYDTLEALGFDVRSRTYELRHVRFPASPGERVVISGPNPSACVTCHQNPVRPNWGPHPYWQGAVGEHPRLTAAEATHLREFVRRGADHPRYRHLRRRENYLRHVRPNTPSPAAEMDRHLLAHSLVRVPAWLQRTRNYSRQRFALVAALADCPDIPAYLPELRDEARWQRVAQDTARRFSRLPAFHRNALAPASDDVTAKLRYLLELQGVDMGILPTSFPEKHLLSATGTLFPHLIKGLAHTDPHLRSLGVPYPALASHLFPTRHPPTPELRERYRSFCEDLKRRSGAR